MNPDELTRGVCARADHTLTLQTPKLSFYQPENAAYIGKISILDIQLDATALDASYTTNHLLSRTLISSFLPKRSTFDHKGTFGHALLVCGGYGKVGAALLAAQACLRVGVGKLTVHVPRSAYQILQLGVPEAMVSVDDHEFFFTRCPDLAPYTAIGIGCGIGTKASTHTGLSQVLESSRTPMVIDADAINILAAHPEFLSSIPVGSVMTPHPGEYERLFGKDDDSFARLEKQKSWSKELKIYIVYKNAHTCVTTPEGLAYFNATGNPGMATAGSGDVLTGMITGLLAQRLPINQAVLSAVYLHGLAGDIAADQLGQNALLARDIVDNIGKAISKTQMILE
ncbi:UNVERIFIED_CONTAM: hypothetical protein GTU68_064405 [Idotea baltica]|nr:hypothetical protein [Idotea baltica]